MMKLIAIALTALVAVSHGRPAVSSTLPLVQLADTKVKTLPLVIPVKPHTFPIEERVGPTAVPKTLPLVEPVVPTKLVPKTFPSDERVIPKTFPLVEPVNPTKLVPKTFPSDEKIVPKTFPLNKRIGSTAVPKTLPLVEPIVPTKLVPKTFPSDERVIPKTFPLVEPANPTKLVPKTFPSDERIVPKTFPLNKRIGSTAVPKTLPLVEPVEPTKVAPLTFPRWGNIPIDIVPHNFKHANLIQTSPEEANLPVIVPVDSVPKDLPLVDKLVFTSLSKTFPLVKPADPTKLVPKTFPSNERVVPKTFPLSKPVNPEQRTLPLNEPVESKAKTFPLKVPVEHQETAFQLIVPSFLADANNQFGVSLMKKLFEDKKNVFYSPYGLSSALAMLYSGAKGVTAQQMRQVLKYNYANLMDDQLFKQNHEVMESMKAIKTKNTEMALNVANKLVLQKDFDVLESYMTNLKKYFDSSVERVDFSDKVAIDKINQWVRTNTNDKIKSLLDGPLDQDTKLILLNAIYFKGVFQIKFDEKMTKEEVFFTDDNHQKISQMMRRKGRFNLTEVPELDSAMIEIPYTGHDVSLFVVLPNQRQGLKNLNRQITDWSQIENAIFTMEEKTVDLFLPKFKIETNYNLKSTLSSMGMSSAFSSSADLSGVDGRQDLKVSEVVHKAFVEVNEEGTEAAAVTGVIVGTTAVVNQPPVPVFRADHPFLFFIRDNINRENLFVGQVNQL